MAMSMAHPGLQASSGLFSSQRTAAVRRRGQLIVRAAVAVPPQFKTVAPVGDRVFVKVDANEEATVGGILLPTSAQKKPTRGSIVGLGKAKAVKDGDKVVYSKYAGTELKLQGSEYVILKEDDVIGILNSDNIVDLKPLGDRILIEVAESDTKTAGGVILTAGSTEKPTLGKVIAVGAGKEDDDGKVVAPNLKTGDVVLYSRYSGTEFVGKDDKEYVVVREVDVLATMA